MGGLGITFQANPLTGSKPAYRIPLSFILFTVNLDGEVVGINSMKLEYADGIGFAIPMDIASQVRVSTHLYSIHSHHPLLHKIIPSPDRTITIQVIQQLMKYKRVRRPYVGLSFRLRAIDMGLDEFGRPQRELGMLILGVKPGSPAEKAGVQEGDVVIEIDGKKVSQLGSQVKKQSWPPLSGS